jgi:hypothetical protein
MTNNTSENKSYGGSLHYRLTADEWLRASKELKPAERTVLYYLRTLDPFGDRDLNLKIVDIAAECDLNKGTVSRAIKALDRKEWIDAEIIQVKISLRTKKLSTGNQVVYRQPLRSPDNLDDQETTSTIVRQLARSPDNNRGLKPLSEEGSITPHTDQTDQTIQTLSDPPRPPLSEREEGELMEFVAKQNKDARSPRAYALKCLKEDRKYWEEKFWSYKTALERAKVPPPVAAENFEFSTTAEPISPASRVDYYQAMMSGPMRNYVVRQVAEHPEWGLRVEGDRLIQEVEGCS